MTLEDTATEIANRVYHEQYGLPTPSPDEDLPQVYEAIQSAALIGLQTSATA